MKTYKSQLKERKTIDYVVYFAGLQQNYILLSYIYIYIYLIQCLPYIYIYMRRDLAPGSAFRHQKDVPPGLPNASTPIAGGAHSTGKLPSKQTVCELEN